MKGVVEMAATTQYPIVFKSGWVHNDELSWSHLVGNHRTVSEDAGTVCGMMSIDEMFDVNAVARIEFIRNELELKRGAILMDAHGRILVHVVNALLGYVGRGPALSEMICDAVGIPTEIFEAIQNEAFGIKPYAIALWRTSPSEWDWERLPKE